MGNKLVRELNENNIIAHTTETVIGLMAKLERENIFKINQMKRRPLDQPLQVLASSVEQLIGIVKDIEVLKENNDSKISYIVEADEKFAHDVLLPSFNKTIMIRIVGGELAEIINEVGPLFASSANQHGKDSIREFEKIELVFGVQTNKKDGQEGSRPSKIVSLVDENKIIRE